MAEKTTNRVRKLIAEALTARTASSYRRRVNELMRIGTRGVFDASAALIKSKAPKRRKLGADVLSQLGYQSSIPPFKDQSAPLLLALLVHEREPAVKAAAITALARLNVRSAIPTLVAFVADPSTEVRWALAAELIFSAAEERIDPSAIAALIQLSNDRVGLVRNWACFSLASSEIDTPEIRQVFWRHATDRHHDTRMEALRGLARRRDPNVQEPLRKAVETIGWGRLGTWLMDDLVDYATAVGDKALINLLNG
jgi:HEAT repeat protein